MCVWGGGRHREREREIVLVIIICSVHLVYTDTYILYMYVHVLHTCVLVPMATSLNSTPYQLYLKNSDTCEQDEWSRTTPASDLQDTNKNHPKYTYMYQLQLAQLLPIRNTAIETRALKANISHTHTHTHTLSLN